VTRRRPSLQASARWPTALARTCTVSSTTVTALTRHGPRCCLAEPRLGVLPHQPAACKHRVLVELLVGVWTRPGRANKRATAQITAHRSASWPWPSLRLRNTWHAAHRPSSTTLQSTPAETHVSLVVACNNCSCLDQQGCCYCYNSPSYEARSLADLC